MMEPPFGLVIVVMDRRVAVSAGVTIAMYAQLVEADDLAFGQRPSGPCIGERKEHATAARMKKRGFIGGSFQNRDAAGQ